ncbi:T9SS type A sorting domain-containing protein [Hymenobacter psychrotolerans]|uniref:Por secretion system C-terminal sorting domain-containing protein n=1 Tax=Hymenobacter psychrotolerans DSM 18569 TaxID=1121959 RepID=A0A1M7AFN4_9BACT|nr:T9SS type A sorting domain-containing protein [Hymenobacter psychrotolerans]SHL41425.1 Por secretion system C-terminal sorting domain-containing protein [Hymenobacter psychrotolerans DSM 18569]
MTLVAFGAVRDGAVVRCDWKTASEQNNRRFVVERSANGQDFTALGTVAGSGTTSTARSYSYTDVAPLAGTAYYRLRQEDTDGTAAYSPVVAVQGCAGCGVGRLALAVAPNPGTGLFRLLDQHNAPLAITGTVSNLMGQTVRELHAEATLDLSTQPAGVYLLRVSTAQGPQVLRVVKE